MRCKSFHVALLLFFYDVYKIFGFALQKKMRASHKYSVISIEVLKQLVAAKRSFCRLKNVLTLSNVQS